MTRFAYAEGHEKGPGVGGTCLRGGDMDPSWSVRGEEFQGEDRTPGRGDGHKSLYEEGRLQGLGADRSRQFGHLADG